LDPDDWHSSYRLGTLLLDGGEAARASALLEKVARLRPDFLPAREQMGLALIRRRDLKGATTAAEALIGKSPQAAEGHRIMALVLWKQREYDASLAECALALAADPSSTPMQTLQALELWQLDRKKDARTAFVQAAKGSLGPKLGTAEIFCRLLLCDAGDIAVVDEFLRKNRWAIMPNPQP
ncbi:MAG TPA: tetratricopeptide repeat protein, partial [Terriglobia bacterium]|nr:tetratricopeptide repeat protein [Terriglobia bacterium]